MYISLLIVICIILLYYNYQKDLEDIHTLNGIICHKEVSLPSINTTDRLVIESIIEEYWKKRKINKSRCAKIINDIKTGISRGIMSGFITGMSPTTAVTGGVALGAVSGVLKAYNLSYSPTSYLKSSKHT